MVQLEHESETAEVVVGHQTAVVVVGAGKGELGLVGTARQTHVVAVREHIGAEHVFLPVDGLDALVQVEVVEHTKLLVEGVQTAGTAYQGVLIVRHHIVVGVHRVQTLRHGLRLYETVVGHLRLAALGVLRRNKNHTVGTLRTVDGG